MRLSPRNVGGDQHLGTRLDDKSRRHLETICDSTESMGRMIADLLTFSRIGRAEEFANMACFLASDAGSYITGTAINIDGGRSPVV